MAVSHNVEDSVIPAIDDIIRNEPIFFLVPSAIFEPLSTERAFTIGYKIPDLAVLLGKAGAINISAAMIE